MPTIIASKLSDILKIIAKAIVYNGPYKENQVVVSLDENMFPTPGEPMVIILPGKQIKIEEQVSGAGNKLIGWNGLNRFRLLDRWISDVAYQDSYAVLNSPDRIGILDQVFAFAGLLSLSIPVNEFGDGLTEEPIRIEYFDTPKRYPNSDEWIFCDVFFEMRWYQEVSFISTNPFLV